MKTKSSSILWQGLQPGDRVDIIAPASRCHPSVLEKVKSLLASWELDCYCPNDILGEDLLCANSIAVRTQQLQQALLNTESKAVWSLLGGYGSTQLIPSLLTISPPMRTKIFMGFSDITALHIFLQTQWGWNTVHGPSARQAALAQVSPDSIERVHALLMGKAYAIEYDPLVPLNIAAEKNLLISAPIIGGNLSLIQASLATPWQINASHKILFFEEINERAYRIERTLEQLKQANILSNVKAILIGDITGGAEPNGTSFISPMLAQFAASCKVPVLRIANIGHEFINYPLLLGYPAELQLGNNCTLRFNLTDTK